MNFNFRAANPFDAENANLIRSDVVELASLDTGVMDGTRN
jgi:hypothetical protein